MDDVDITQEWCNAYVDLSFSCPDCGKDSILHFEDGQWQNTDYDPINLETGKSIFEEDD
jgi:predicted RNA-binding Zn-ribbon protein involved in translation (DUF1610 family)